MIQAFKKIIKVEIAFYIIIAILSLLTSCKKEKASKELALHTTTNNTVNEDLKLKEPSQEFKNYWYAGQAEISSYKLEQARYGEIRSGHAVLIYVTEDFLPNIQVKADRQNANSVSVLKLNATKKFNTGIYPYSIMQSTFYPVSNNKHAVKISSSMQEWCGHVYAQLNNKEQFEIMSHSYFEGEADKSFNLDKAILENELWTQLRIDPKSLPTGDLEIIPSFEYNRLRHVPIKAYKALATMQENIYSISYPELNRTLSITFNPNFPHDILSWEEHFKSGFGANAKVLKTKATKLKTIKSAYWGKNTNKDEILRKELHLQ
ncbi:septum formation inhibitor Maf [Flavivirga spongiicola]|uniref:Septum formation inhibitor Maf n=1 Tax=Flavivirga spongiicola TaxID=421621 RepID=A0ABU7XNA0_9FLAO|nr:septum formation inhibitor Maf [Flavivirga sp. MEBiC05379]MDO5981886.1 septum formation inhibitor Maf [Flavivirga sp. MEBiC05379]